MAIKYAEECAFRPVVTLFRWWLHYVKNDGHSVFIVVSDDALVGIRRVATDNAVLAN